MTRRGTVSVMAALAAVPLVFLAGVAVDGARAWTLQSRLATALDAAALATARNIGAPPAERDGQAAGLFWAHFAAAGPAPAAPAIGGRRPGFLNSAAVFEPPMQVDERTVRVSATATIPATLTRVLGYRELTARASAEARRAEMGLEVALVLDVTGSMDTLCPKPSDRRNANCQFTTPLPRDSTAAVTSPNDNNLNLLRLAAADLVNLLFGNRESVPNLWVSVVPFTTTVNIGPQRASWLTPAAQASLAQDFAPATWRGCVEARVGYPGAPPEGDTTDLPPRDAPFRPFLNRSTLDDYTLNTQPMAGDNDWARRAWTAAGGAHAITEGRGLYRGDHQVGPNVGCPVNQVLPLTASRSAVLAAIDALRPSFRGGTMSHIGLLGGWFTLSPRWREAWALGPPPAGHASALPLDYNARLMRKAVVMMTDGDNTWNDVAHGLPGSCTTTGTDAASFPTAAAAEPPPGPAMPIRPRPCPASSQVNSVVLAPGAAPVRNNSDYTGYGRRLENRITVSELNARTAALCTQLKGLGIQIYTVVLSPGGTVSDATRQLYQQCATVPGNYFLVSQPTQLRAAFRQIGGSLANVRLTQ
ncbi:pilus assembly protein TadG-related protein [Roseococcus sp. DSY-14]|uniref:pilus assembly protein TadG-related protein n=1 Tax=Roseococcus sp. DSY-14 TaxID=3369650 RepID=UPI00387B9916